MSKYLLDKFLFTVDRDPELTERYREDPAGTVEWWEQEMANTLLNCTPAERTSWLAFTDDERRALREHDHVALFTLGAHPFLTLTLFIAMFERDHGPLEYQKAYGRAMQHISLPYPDIAT
jgi:nitroreductase